MEIIDHVEIASEAVPPLGEVRPRIMDLFLQTRIVAFTINPNPKVKHKVDNDNVYYQFMTHQQQHDYLRKYIKNVYLSRLSGADWVYWIYELTQDNNMHVHGIIVSDDINDEYSIQMFRKLVYSHPMTILNMPRKQKTLPKDWMNNISYIQTEEKLEQWLDYMQKDKNIKRRFPDEQFRSISTVSPSGV